MRGHPFETIGAGSVQWDNDLLSAPLFFLTMAGANVETIKKVYQLWPAAIEQSIVKYHDDDVDDNGPTLLFIACHLGASFDVIAFLASKYPVAANKPLATGVGTRWPIHVAMATATDLDASQWDNTFPIQKITACTVDTVKLLADLSPTALKVMDKGTSLVERALINYTPNQFIWMAKEIKGFFRNVRIDRMMLAPRMNSHMNQDVDRQLEHTIDRAPSLCFGWEDDQTLALHAECFAKFLQILLFIDPPIRKLAIKWPDVSWDLSRRQFTHMDPDASLLSEMVLKTETIKQLEICGTAGSWKDRNILRPMISAFGKFGRARMSMFILSLIDFVVDEDTYNDLFSSGVRNLETSCIKVVQNSLNNSSNLYGETCTLEKLHLDDGRDPQNYPHYPNLLSAVPNMQHLNELIISNFVTTGSDRFEDYLAALVQNSKSLIKLTLGFVGRSLKLHQMAAALCSNDSLQEFRISTLSVATIAELNCFIPPLQHHNTKLRYVARLDRDSDIELPDVGDSLMYLTSLNHFGRGLAQDPKIWELLANISSATPGHAYLDTTDLQEKSSRQLSIINGLLSRNPAVWSAQATAAKISSNRTWDTFSNLKCGPGDVSAEGMPLNKKRKVTHHQT